MGPELDVAIKSEVDSLLKQESVYQTHLQSAERRLRGLSKSFDKIAGRAAARACSVVKGQAPPQCSVSMNAQTVREAKQVPSLPPINATGSPEKNMWAKIIDYNLKQFKDERQKEQEIELEKKRRVKAELDRQIQDKARAKESEKHKQLAFDVGLIKQTHVLDEQESKKMQELKAKIMKERSMRDQQLKGSVVLSTL